MARALATEIAGWIRSPWLDDVIASTAAGPAGALRGFVAATRQVGRDLVAAPAGAVLHGPDDEITVAGWSADTAARVAILCALDRHGHAAAAADTLHREGDNREKAAIVRALCLLEHGGAVVELALDAGRTNDTTLFGALATDNPYPARHYPELEFNKLVMKAAFVGAPIERIVGLDRRANPELSRMAMEYIDEQQSARRRFPPAMFLAIAPHPGPGSVGRLIGYLGHAIAENRLWAARALARARDDQATPFLRERASIERNADVREAIAAALSKEKTTP